MAVKSWLNVWQFNEVFSTCLNGDLIILTWRRRHEAVCEGLADV